MWRWLEKSKIIKNDLLNFKDEPLSRLSILLLIVLDIFILSNVNIGVQAERAKVPKAYHYFPYSCTKHFEAVQTTYDAFDAYHYRKSYTPSDNSQSQQCQELHKKINIFAATQTFKKHLKNTQSLEEKIEQNRRRLDTIAQQYNTRLFERIANMPNNHALKDAKNEYDALTQDSKKLQSELAKIPSVTSLKGYQAYHDYVTTTKTAFEKTKASYIFWQPFKAYGYMLAFIMPLLLIFAIIYRNSYRKSLRNESYNPVVKIISAHTSVILALPLIWYTLNLIYHVIPKTLLKKLIDFLVDIGLLSLLNYFFLFIVIALFGSAIYLIQKRILKHKQAAKEGKNHQKLIAMSECFACHTKIDYSKNFCPFCGVALHDHCPSCNESVIKHESFCHSCGVAMPKTEEAQA